MCQYKVVYRLLMQYKIYGWKCIIKIINIKYWLYIWKYKYKYK